MDLPGLLQIAKPKSFFSFFVATVLGRKMPRKIFSEMYLQAKISLTAKGENDAYSG
jgi:hypothetical protein